MKSDIISGARGHFVKFAGKYHQFSSCEEAEQTVGKWELRADRFAGRELSKAEYSVGVAKDTREARQIKADEDWQPVADPLKPVPEPKTYWEKQLEEVKQANRAKYVGEEQAKIENWIRIDNEKKSQAELVALHENNPSRQRLRSELIDLELQVAFSKFSGNADIVALERLRTQIEHDTDTAEAMQREMNKSYRERADTHRKHVQKTMAVALEDLDAYGSDEPAPAPAPVSAPTSTLDEQIAAKVKQQVDEIMGVTS
jgi:hypothetical protein